MDTYQKDFTVIIPQRNSIATLGRLFETIPESDRIEIIVVDNSPVPITKEDIGIDREYDLFWAAPQRCAGGARNVGIEHAHGKWLLFADADDYYPEDAFDVFFSEIDDEAEVVYFGMTGVYDDTGEFSPRGDYYTNKVRDFLAGRISENDLRLQFGTPCSKMVRKDLIDRYNLRFDEVIASNDSYFALTVGYYAKTIKAVDRIVYVATVSKGSITRRRDYNALHSRYLVKLKMNSFMREHGLSNYQGPVMSNIFECVKSAHLKIFTVLGEAVRYRQNIFLGFNIRNWFQTLTRKKSEKEKRYEVK